MVPEVRLGTFLDVIHIFIFLLLYKEEMGPWIPGFKPWNLWHYLGTYLIIRSR